MDEWRQDIHFAYRIWRKAPSITVPVLLILALGIGANTAIFSLVDAIWWRPLPIRAPHELLKITSHKLGSEASDRPLSYPEVEDVRAGVPALRSVAVSSRRAVILRTERDSALLSAAVISSGYFDTLGVTARLGEVNFGDQLDSRPGNPVVVLSFDAWRKYFAGDKAIIGKPVTLNSARCIIAAVLPREFRGTEPFASPAIWIPLGTWVQINPGERSNQVNREFWDWDAFARLAPGASLKQAQDQFDAISQQMAIDSPQQEQGRRLTIARNDEITEPQVRTLGSTLSILAAVVLLIAAVNVSILLLAFGRRRRRELATRIACGATRSRLLRQLISESCLLAAVSCMGALLIGCLLVRMLPGLLPSSVIPVGLDFRLDTRVLSWTLGISVLTVIGSAFVPALAALRFDLVPAIKEGPNGVSSGGRRMASRSIMVIAQIAGSVVLLVATGLMFRTMLKIQSVDPGFDRNRQLLFVDVSLGMTGYDRESVQKYYEQVLAVVSPVAGVSQAALTRRVPLSPSGTHTAKTVYFENSDAETPDGARIGYTSVSPAYFSVMGTRLLRGRVFSMQDNAQRPRAVIINENAARRFFPGGDAIGRRLLIGSRAAAPYEIIGIVEDGKYAEITEGPQPYMFLALAQEPSAELTVIVATEDDPSIFVNYLRQRVRNVDPRVPVLDARTLREHLRFASYTRRMAAELVLALALLGLVLAMTGLYGLMSHVVDSRAHEIGIRLALGGRASTIVWLVLRYSVGICLAGLAVGIVLALAGSRAISSLLFGVGPSDPATFIAVAIASMVIALLATAVPLRTALRVDPMQVLRHE